jgi:Holliday junction resolvase
MRYRRVMRDSNHKAIVDALKAVGCSVLDLAAVGGGCPDILAANSYRTVLMEIKRPGVIGKKAGKLRAEVVEKQTKFRDSWRGPVATVSTVEEAIAALCLPQGMQWVGGRRQ